MTIFKNNKNEFINCVDKNLKRLRSKNRSNQLKEEEILYELKKYNLKDAIKSIAIIYQSMYHNVKSKDIRVFACEHPSFPCLLRVDTLTKLTHLFIKSGTNDYKTKLISENLEANILWLNGILSNHLENKIPLNNETILNHLCILYYEQIELQKNVMHCICRNYLIYDEELGTLFKKITKLSLQEYFYLCFVMIAYLNNNPPFFYKNKLLKIAQEGRIPYCSASSLNTFIEHISIDYAGYREKINLNNNFMPIQEYPIIKTVEQGQKLYIVPVPPYLIEKVYNGIFFDFEKAFASKIKFREKFGQVFEKYVGKFIEYYAPQADIKPEKAMTYIKNRSNADFADWTIIEKDIAYIIEVKSVMMPLSDIYNTTTTAFVRKHIIKAYKQIITKINDINRYDELAFLRNKTIIPIIVFRNIPYINSKLFYNMVINDTLEAYIAENPEEKFIKDYLYEKNIFAFNIDEFEYYWINRNNIQIKALFEEAIQDSAESITSIMSKQTDIIQNNAFFDEIFEKIIPIKELKSY